MLFKCKRSGNTINVEQPDDIERMKTHEEYTQVSTHSQGEQDGLRKKAQDAEAPEAEVKALTQSQQLHQPKRRGRPARQVEQANAVEI
jgi:hypothetical protein